MLIAAIRTIKLSLFLLVFISCMCPGPVIIILECSLLKTVCEGTASSQIRKMHFLVKWSEDRPVFNSMQFCFQDYWPEREKNEKLRSSLYDTLCSAAVWWIHFLNFISWSSCQTVLCYWIHSQATLLFSFILLWCHAIHLFFVVSLHFSLISCVHFRLHCAQTFTNEEPPNNDL